MRTHPTPLFGGATRHKKRLNNSLLSLLWSINMFYIIDLNNYAFRDFGALKNTQPKTENAVELLHWSTCRPLHISLLVSSICSVSHNVLSVLRCFPFSQVLLKTFACVSLAGNCDMTACMQSFMNSLHWILVLI